MFAVVGDPSISGNPLSWSLLFARQPEPDLEFTEEELEQATNVRSSAPLKPPKKSGGRPILWIVVLLLVGGGAYVAMEPEIITDLLVGESAMSPGQSSVASQPSRPMPAPGTPAMEAPNAAPTSPLVPTPETVPPASVPTPTAPGPSITGSVPVAPPTSPTASSSPILTIPSPMFGEGQKVTVTLASSTPGDMVTLMQDPAGTKPGLPIRPGTTLTVLDGDLQSGGWVYSVRSDEGIKGWIAENRLRLKP